MIGSGDPTIGNNPSTIDKLTAIYIKIAKAKPKQNSRAQILLQIAPIWIILKIIIVYNIKSPTDPINPNYSENKVKIKSVCFSGRKSK